MSDVRTKKRTKRKEKANADEDELEGRVSARPQRALDFYLQRRAAQAKQKQPMAGKETTTMRVKTQVKAGIIAVL